jgi:hypothetical protein
MARSQFEYTARVDHEEINFLEALAGLVLAPHETTHILFQDRNPPYGWTLFLCFLASSYVPFFAQNYKYGYDVWDSGVVIGLTLVLFFGLLFFLLLEGIFLQLLKVSFNMQMLFSCVAYSLTPMILALWLVYGFNYLSEGRLTFTTYLLTGFGSLDDRFLKIIPFALGICALWIFLVFIYSMKNMAKVSFIVGLLISTLTLIPFAIAIGFATLVADRVRPGTFEILLSLVNFPVFSGSY